MPTFIIINTEMKRSFDIKPFKFYLWIALGFYLLSLFGVMGDFPGKFSPLAVNNIWATIYVTILNFILFEYTVPFVLKKRKTIVYNITFKISK